MTVSDPVVIASAARTPIGWFQGDFSTIEAPHLGATAIRAAIARSGVDPTLVDGVFMGCVLSAGLRQNPARQAAHYGGLPFSAPTLSVNKLCGSGMMAMGLGYDALAAGSASLVVAGGQESMTNAPYLLKKARSGYRLGHGEIYDHMFHDGLEDAYEPGQLMGHFAELTVRQYGFTREQQDDYAIQTLERARKAVESGAFAAEIAPITVKTRKGEVVISHDENPLKADPKKIPTLRPAFGKDGTITPASSSGISDGAAALVMTRRTQAEKLGLPVLATVRGYSVHAMAPRDFTIAPVPAMEKLLSNVDWRVGDVDLFEVNEAFAVTAMVAQKDLGIPDERLNVNGGACALGHPIGATGARLITTLIHALKARGRHKGVASACIGGGEAIAMAVELP
ncbi:acetyl-CoA C-acyltransferase [Acetobacter tropicalis]|uniref:Acetyl-CoA acetyltransferase n=1 Tax=Acetobacter tropicalis TaxID=104102 RepID=A0A094ZFZ4_9PROT|nr:acetyl-CoA C-acyltransferase [Acetobacter tropicalis]KAA8391300.1 acetyl-CoA C-acyltransferase [Acetobacter tropicalis]KAA8391554.1 acetyl-CoA C-acyltransferase [Acetobacter tropicalis]KGB21526.1 acetyl-CoA acetyltransferase [Acetobacter tropicalis]MBC9007829.1 acetyl-CoA C-acyltransferase [Acetobacter tropicalis]MDO8172474.1 acetyl-CoA C-acyltransferase [Acetobacter tropicalis]